MVLKQNKRVILIVMHALSAGKDLRLLKSKVRFGIDLDVLPCLFDIVQEINGVFVTNIALLI